MILDYVANVEGFPTFEVLSFNGDTSGLEITYSESREVLETPPSVNNLTEDCAVKLLTKYRAMVLSLWRLQWTRIVSISTTSRK